MKEQIILAPSLNENEILRTLARFKNNTIGLKVFNGVDLAKFSLMKSGIAIEGKYISLTEENAIVYSIIKEIDYFKNASLKDVENIVSTLHMIKGLAVSDEEKTIIDALKGSDFKEKNDALIEVYQKLKEEKEIENYIDNEGIIRLAIDKADILDCEFIKLKEYELSPLEEALLNKVSNGNVTTKCIGDLFITKEEGEHSISFTKAYGEINEVKDVIVKVCEEKYNFDDVVIAVTNSKKYAQILLDLNKEYEIPMSFGTGISITNSYPMTLLNLLVEWHIYKNHGVDSLKEIFYSPSFDYKKLESKIGETSSNDKKDLINVMGQLRISFDRSENERRINEYVDAFGETEEIKKIKIIAKEFEQGIKYLIKEYSVIRLGNSRALDKAGLNCIIEMLSSYENILDDSIIEILDEIKERSVLVEQSMPSKIHVTSLNKALSSIRKHVFIVGLSSNEFPGVPKENYLILDDELNQLGKEDIIPTSKNIVSKTKTTFTNLLNLCKALNLDVNLSYSSFDLRNLKMQNPSSVFTKEYRDIYPEDGKEEHILKAGYELNKLDSAINVVKEYLKGNEIRHEEQVIEFKDSNNKDFLEKEWSPSEIETFLSCRRKFYIRSILRIKEDELDDPMEVISSKDLGTLCHTIMEKASNKLSEEEFKKLCEKEFNDFFKKRPPILQSDLDNTKKDFDAMMENAFEMENENEVVSSEKEYSATHDSGIKLHGYPDRIEKDKDSKHIIVDFKTKRNIEHQGNDVKSCIQTVIYAWLLEKEGYDVKSCEYRYIRLKEKVELVYTQNAKDKLNEILSEFKKALENNNFDMENNKDNCKYCRYIDFCDFQLKGETK